ncbi:hypothetical protein QMM42_17625 [Leptospira santarosai]|uniref:hypothetical protein n=1 Tax=Leptospira santarosai TaxID=28183 RepID=UPI0024AEC1D3|nr:hypothetical protein [Leptospira santarosai]MDI7187991.1 hypothetical protein [Leptospira santarosai]MDI7201761.1 hypothetical protein [Leptospira santarosai]MDI7208703.1 hypothetical protein [Leptospira santarosai]
MRRIFISILSYLFVCIVLVSCIEHKLIYWNVPKNSPKSDLVKLRRFNAGIRAIDGVSVTLDRFDDVVLLPGRHTVNIQPEMWVSTFPMGKHLEQIKTISFEAYAGNVVYLCLGLQLSHEWNPFAVIMQFDKNPTQQLLSAMGKNGGCVSSSNTLPVLWTDR